jgi:uncharacterized spore protein YtfJ
MTRIENDRLLDTLREAANGATAGRVFGEPVIHGDIVLVPVARVAGGGGGGGGTSGQDSAAEEPGPGDSGSGGGFGTTAKGLGVFMLKNGQVTWHPALDVTRVVLGGQLVAIAALLVARSVLRSHGKSRAARSR